MLVCLAVLADDLRARVRDLRGHARRDLGASALEWAIIAAIAVVIASIIGAVIYHVVSTKSNDLNNCANQPVNTSCSPAH